MDQQLTGFFGKVPSHGDFVSRRLPEAFLRPWDTWLQNGLQHSRERLGERWLEVYLCSPVWRFALAAGVCGDQGWAGVMLPSVDRVGRYFPLTVAVAVASEDVPPFARLEQDAQWYAQAERLALSTLVEGFTMTAFDSALRALPPPSSLIRVEEGAAGHSLFWTEGSPLLAPSTVDVAGLPGASTFVDMLAGRSQE
jgi:type VI secretion system protein ImpM